MPTYLAPGVFVEELDSGSRPIEGVGTAVAAFVGLAEAGPFNAPTLVSNWKQFTSKFGGFAADAYLAHAVYGYFLNGGGNCYIVRIGREPETKPARTELPATVDDGDTKPKYIVEAKESGASGDELAVEVIDVVGEGDEKADKFKLIVRRGRGVEEEHDNLTAIRGKQNAVSVVNQHSKLIKLIEADDAPATRPRSGLASLTGGSTVAQTEIASADYIGDPADRTGFGGLETIDAVTMVCVPDLMSAYQQRAITADGVKAVQLAMIAHCELMGDRVAIIDPPPDMSAQSILRWRMDEAGYDSKYAALYWPWLKVNNPATNDMIHVPPCGHVAGVWGRNDDTRGVHKAPANEVVRGALEPRTDLTSREQELLNPEGVNCIRALSGRGVRIWGARTLSSDPAWRYLNVRRLFNYLEESILTNTQWVVFEPNDEALWAKIRRTISSFLIMEWRKGALFGNTPSEAFFVACDSATNTQESIDAGQVICEIGVAPVKPAEFVIFRLSQYSGGAAVGE